MSIFILFISQKLYILEILFWIFFLRNILKTRVIRKELRVFEAFAGIGSQRKALNQIKIKHKIVGMAEWYISAIVAYQAIHNNFSQINYDDTPLDEMINYLKSKPLSIDSKTLVNTNYWKRKHLNDIRIIYNAVKMSENEGNIFNINLLHKRTLKNIDLFIYSFPCQDLSQQGKQKGMSKNSNSRSGLLWEIEKALDATNIQDLPQYLLLENVKALTYKPNQKDLNLWMKKLEFLGYKNDLKILNATNFGSPQVRRRAFMLSTLATKVCLPVGKKQPKPINFILDDKVAPKDLLPVLDKYDLSEPRLTKSNIKKRTLLNYSKFNSENYVYNPHYSGPTLTASGANSRIKINYKEHIRKLNAREAYKYMGFSEEDFNKVNNLNFLNETKIIFTAGNSISIEVLKAIMKVIKMRWNNGC